MKLEPIAKPIRIRIKLGKSEYSNLDDVKKNFSIEELYPLFKDGRLERWLRQNGEIQFADKVVALSKHCGNGSLADYVLFISLFFDSVSKTFTSYEDLLPIKKYLFAAPIEVIRDIYTYTKDLSEIDWKENLANILTVDNVHTFFEDELLRTVYSDTEEWGKIFNNLVKTDNDYIHIFNYFKQQGGRNPFYNNVITDFIYESNSRFNWLSFFKDNFNIELVNYLCQIKVFDILSVNWDEFFAAVVYTSTLEKIHDLYSYTKNFSRINWKHYISDILTLDNVHTFFEDELLHTVYSDKKEWGSVFSNLVKTESDYKQVFNYLEQKGRINSNYNKVFADFISESNPTFDWLTVFKDQLTFERVKSFFLNSAFQGLSVDWGKVFAVFIEDWGMNSKDIEYLLRDRNQELDSFYKHCVSSGIQEAKARIISKSWKELASESVFDYLQVKNALYLWKMSEYDKNKYYFDHINSKLGREILDFLQIIIDLNKEPRLEYLDKSKYLKNMFLLEDETRILIEIQKRNRSGKFSEEAKEMLSSMCNRNVEFAIEVKKQADKTRESERLNYQYLCESLVHSFYEKLKKLRI